MKEVLQRITTGIYYLSRRLILATTSNTNRSRVVIESNGQIVVVKQWYSSGKWHLPGGGTRKNENSGQGAAREVAEEVGLKLNQSDLMFVKDLEFNKLGNKWNLSLFKVNLNSKDSLSLLWYEISQARWIDPKELNDKNASADLLLCLKNCYNKSYV